MKKQALMIWMLAMPAVALSAPPKELTAALSAWAEPRPIERFQFSLIDLNSDGTQDAVVHVTDPAFCGNGGCPLVTFKGTSDAFELVASSGMVRKPVYALEEVRNGWRTLAAVVGFGSAAGLVPIRWKLPQGSYRTTPIIEPIIELTSSMTKLVLNFEETP